MLVKCTILIPIASNGGNLYAASIFQDALDKIYNTFGGYTNEGRVEGTCRTHSGTRDANAFHKVAVYVEPARVGELEIMVADIAHTLRHETICFEKGLSSVKLIPAAKSKSFVNGYFEKEAPLAESKPEKPAGHPDAQDWDGSRHNGRVAAGLCAPSDLSPENEPETLTRMYARDQAKCKLADAIRVSAIASEVRANGGYEVAGHLPQYLVELLRKDGFHVATYRHRGQSATVVRVWEHDRKPCPYCGNK